ncbi:MAG: vWA domain-containing protein [Termitinemataceae bacterium]
MRSIPQTRTFLLSFFLLLFLVFNGFCGDSRSIPLDMYLLIDTSKAMGSQLPEAVQWFESEILTELMQVGDECTLWTLSQQPQEIFSRSITSIDDFEIIRKQLKTIGSLRNTSDFSTSTDILAGIQKAQLADTKRGTQERIAVIFLLLGTGAEGPSKNTEGTASVLRYSRVEDFYGWKLFILGVNIEERTKAAAKQYMAFIQQINPTVNGNKN